MAGVMQVACVLKRGPEYGPDHLYCMADTVLAHNPGTRIVCLTDCDIRRPDVDAVPLVHGWPGWWSKLELFRPGALTGPTLYLDIDTVVTGPLDDVPVEGFTMLPNVSKAGDYGSGAMGWLQTPVWLYAQFATNPDGYMREYRTARKWGDQGFIRDHLGFAPRTFGPECRSYKAHCRGGVPPGTKVVYFHGEPRPWQVGIDWLSH